MQQVSKTGVLLDNRDAYEKSKDFSHEELAMGITPYKWEERAYKQKYFYPYNQSSSLSCVAGGGAVVLEHYDGKVISRKDIYNRRYNYPMGGMAMHDVCEKIRTGACVEEFVPSQNLGENKMNERYTITNAIIQSRGENKVRSTFTIGNNIDDIASVLHISPVIAFWYFDENGREWWREYPEIQFNFVSNVQAGVTRHQVVVVDAILQGGKKYLVVQDTAGVGSGLGIDNNLRLVSEEFVTKRLYSASYAIDDDNEVVQPNPITKPVYTNTKALQVGATGEAVKSLQAVLIYEGLLKIKAPTGFLGGLSRKAIVAYQEKYANEILKPIGLKSGTGIVAGRTNAHMRKLYA
jgi:hypothetical protein